MQHRFLNDHGKQRLIFDIQRLRPSLSVSTPRNIRHSYQTPHSPSKLSLQPSRHTITVIYVLQYPPKVQHQPTSTTLRSQRHPLSTPHPSAFRRPSSRPLGIVYFCNATHWTRIRVGSSFYTVSLSNCKAVCRFCDRAVSFSLVCGRPLGEGSVGGRYKLWLEQV